MQISEILSELESLLERNNLDECWSDWLHESEVKEAATPGEPGRAEILHEILNSENTLRELSAYLPHGDGSSECPEHELNTLLNSLDRSVRRELGE